jgi:hypothetical protein
MCDFDMKSHAFCYNVRSVAKMKLILDSKATVCFSQSWGGKCACCGRCSNYIIIRQAAMGKHEVNEPRNDYDASERFKTTCLLLRFQRG